MYIFVTTKREKKNNKQNQSVQFHPKLLTKHSKFLKDTVYK